AQDRRNADDRYRRDRGERVRDEGAAYPDLIVVRETVVPLLRELRQLPGPRTNVVPALEELCSQVGHDGEMRLDVGADQVRVVRMLGVESRQRTVFRPVAAQVREVKERNGYT